MISRRTTAILAVLLALPFYSVSKAAEWRGSVSTEATYFFKSSTGTENWNFNTAFAADLEFYHDLRDNVSLTINPFVRIDQHDDQRTHADLREFLISASGERWEVNAGLGQVFWGVTESKHLVDIINQADGVEGSDSEDKLGQLMLNVKWSNDFGDLEFFLLPSLRERTYPGIDGRPSVGYTVDTNNPQYESGYKTRSLDTALRWARSFDYWELGLHFFNGTARDPVLLLQDNLTAIPRYQQILQTGIDAQGLFGDLSVKTEIVHKSGDEIENHFEAINGIEYTLIGALAPLQENDWLSAEWCSTETFSVRRSLLCNDRLDIGLVLEHLWDERDTDTSNPFQNDLLSGLRLAFNDERSSEALVGVLTDLNGGATIYSFEASTRVFESSRLSFESQIFSKTADDPVFNALKNESFVKVDLGYFF